MSCGQELKCPSWLGNRVRVGKNLKIRTETVCLVFWVNKRSTPYNQLHTTIGVWAARSFLEWMSYVVHKFEGLLSCEAIRHLVEYQSPNKYSLQALLTVLVKNFINLIMTRMEKMILRTKKSWWARICVHLPLVYFY